MPEATSALLSGSAPRHWIRLRTLILLRWGAILGQIAAIAGVYLIYDIRIPFGLCSVAIGAPIILNLVAMTVLPENKRLSESQALPMVMFDLLQLAFMLYLTGGLNNPFAMLLLAPVTITPGMMGLRFTLVIGATAIVLVTLLALFNIPLTTAGGAEFVIPETFRLGIWAAIIIATLFMGAYSWRISSEMLSMYDALAATQLALAREQKLTDLGGVVAAAAHELGTPLATIKLVSSELVDELSEYPELREDAALIRQQADRCRDILRNMGRAGEDDPHLRQVPLGAVLEEAAEPHASRGKTLHFEQFPLAREPQPVIQRKPELIHGLRNLIQNAVDFADANVWIEARWSETRIAVRIMDDGTGFAPALLGRIGEPFMRGRASGARMRPAYDGMGLGLFIAKTLLERTGARLRFANGSDPAHASESRGSRHGAVVEVVWSPRERIEARPARHPRPHQPKS
ncbi:sensor histidine kinase RegB [Pontibaca methylaminivorans]|uniref:histidine kinase n=1 Tax=Pontibaca methylaminivorans TaxID=515897 RepID=A0A1R3WSK1_9RHOB|nr:ActS/PrrB/RegB family redox-sensitive histidine kinase [Pontibaca methylaminivorans]SIT80996.1 two-component system, sensor histidine kinase RegB [Pontibaca methylaminivorans]